MGSVHPLLLCCNWITDIFIWISPLLRIHFFQVVAQEEEVRSSDQTELAVQGSLTEGATVNAVFDVYKEQSS